MRRHEFYSTLLEKNYLSCTAVNRTPQLKTVNTEVIEPLQTCKRKYINYLTSVFSDETNFNLNEYVNKQNKRY